MSRSCGLTLWQMTAGLSRTEHTPSGSWPLGRAGGRWQPRIFDPQLPALHPHTHTHARTHAHAHHMCPNLGRAVLQSEAGAAPEEGVSGGRLGHPEVPSAAGQRQASAQVRGRVLLPQGVCCPGGGETKGLGVGGALVCVGMLLCHSQPQGAPLQPSALLWRGPSRRCPPLAMRRTSLAGTSLPFPALNTLGRRQNVSTVGLIRNQLQVNGFAGIPWRSFAGRQRWVARSLVPLGERCLPIQGGWALGPVPDGRASWSSGLCLGRAV